jgi:hypothetical protein
MATGQIGRRGLMAGLAALVGAGLARLARPDRIEAGHTSLSNPEPLHIGVLNDGGNAASDESASNITTATVLVGNVNLAPVMRVRQLNPLDDALEAIGGFSSAGTDPGTGLVGIGGARTDVVFTGNGGIGVDGRGGDAQEGQAFQRGGTGVLGTGGGPRFGVGVEGRGGGTSGNQGDGVVGRTNSNTRAGVRAFNSGSGPGVQGNGGIGPGVQGESDTGIGVLGIGTTGAGVQGTATSGTGVEGRSTSGDGILGYSSGNLKYSLAGSGSGQAHGLIGFSQNQFGVSGINNGGNNWAGAFFNAGATAPNSGKRGLIVQGDFVVVNGTKNAAIKTEKHGYRKMYALEATGNYFEDVGSARLQQGKARVELDEMFAETVSSGAKYYVFPVPKSGDSKGLAVVHQDATGFTVQEIGGGVGSYEFDYRVMAKVRGHEGTRMEAFEPPPMPKAPEPVDMPPSPKPEPAERRGRE